jgi:hypothetical protein
MKDKLIPLRFNKLLGAPLLREPPFHRLYLAILSTKATVLMGVGEIMRKIILVLVTLMAACDMEMCGEDKLREASSPNNKYVATVFVRSCGATEGFLYHVNILRSPAASSSRGTNEEGEVLSTSEGRLNVSWRDEKTLIIDCEGCPANKNSEKKLNKWLEINIEYQFRERKTSDRPSNSY